MPFPANIALYKGPIGPLVQRCPLCPPRLVTSDLRRCTGCLALSYCGHEHQTAHRPQHKSVCKKLKKVRAVVAKEEHKVRHATETNNVPANAFATHVGRFFNIVSTRPYMLVRFELAKRLLLLGTVDAVTEGLEHLRDLLRLSEDDDLGVRELVPGTMLRLDLDQECYDFIKWWETADPGNDKKRGDKTLLPFLDVHGADPLEDLTFLGEHNDLSSLVCLLILKLKLLIDIRNIKVTRHALSGYRHLPIEMKDQIELATTRSPLSKKLHLMSHASLLQTEKKLLAQCVTLGAAIDEANPKFMLYLFFDPAQPLRVHMTPHGHDIY